MRKIIVFMLLMILTLPNLTNAGITIDEEKPFKITQGDKVVNVDLGDSSISFDIDGNKWFHNGIIICEKEDYVLYHKLKDVYAVIKSDMDVSFANMTEYYRITKSFVNQYASYRVYYDVKPFSASVKSTIDIDFHVDGEYKLIWFNEGLKDSNNTLTEKDNSLISTNLIFDWNDVKDSSISVQSSIYDVNTKMSIYIDFNLGMRKGLEKLIIDPTTVLDFSQYYGQSQNQRHTFHLKGRYWVFLSDGGTVLRYKHSTDGSSWSALVDAVSWYYPVIRGYGYDIQFDGTYFNIFILNDNIGDNGANEGLAFRRGVPNSDGSITWDSTRTIVAGKESSTDARSYGGGTRMTDGYYWATYSFYDYSTWWKVLARKSTNTDGSTWTTAYTIDAGSSGKYAYWSDVYALPNGDAYFIWSQYDQYDLKGMRYYNNNSTFSATITIDADNAINHDVVEDTANGLLHLTYIETDADGGDIIYRKYTASTNSWSAETEIENTNIDSAQCPSPQISKCNNDLRIYWIYNDRYIRYANYSASSGTWSDDASFTNEASNLIYWLNAPDYVNGTSGLSAVTWEWWENYIERFEADDFAVTQIFTRSVSASFVLTESLNSIRVYLRQMSASFSVSDYISYVYAFVSSGASAIQSTMLTQPNYVLIALIMITASVVILWATKR